MRSVVLPHLTASQDAWSLGDWYRITEAGEKPLGHRVDHWDFTTPLELSCEIEVNVDDVRTQAALSDEDELIVACFWESTSTGIRELGYSGVLPQRGYAEGEVILRLEANVLGGNLKLLRQIVLTKVGDHRDPLAAERAGSVIVSEPSGDAKVVALEGTGARFPTELTDFSAIPVAEPDALWYLDIATGDLEVAALAAMRLHLNSAHPAVARALDPEDPIGTAVRSAMRWDVARTVIRSALSNPDFIQGWGSFEQESLGAVMEGLIHRYWPGETAEALRSREQDHSVRFEYQLQARLRLMAELP